MANYPEHEKLKRVQPDSQKLGEFLEWLGEQGYTICEPYSNSDSPRDGEYVPMRETLVGLLARYFEIDQKKIEEEKQAMLEHMRRLNESDKKWEEP